MGRRRGHVAAGLLDFVCSTESSLRIFRWEALISAVSRTVHMDLQDFASALTS